MDLQRKHRVVVEVTMSTEETEKEAALRLEDALEASMETLYFYGITIPSARPSTEWLERMTPSSPS